MKYTKIKKFITTLRIETGETQIEMAKRLGVSPSYISKIEGGKKNISKWFVEQLVKEYNITKEEQEYLLSLRVCRDNASAMKILLEMQRELLSAPQMTFTKAEIGQWLQGHLNKLKGE